MITNHMNQSFELRIKVGTKYLEGAWYSDNEPIYIYQVTKKNHEIRSESFGDFSRHNELYRLIYNKEGELIKEEYITENHALMMYSTFIEEH